MGIRGKLPNIRAAYRAAPGCKLVHGDYSQLELNIRADVMHDDVLRQHLDSGDVYRMNAQEWFGGKNGTIPESAKKLSNDEFKAKENYFEERQSSKIGHLASQYGAGPAVLWKQALETNRNFQFGLALHIHEAFHSTYFRTVEFWAEEYKRVLANGYSETRILQRRRLYPRPPPPTETNNYPIQGTAADVVNLVMIDLAAALRKMKPAKLIGQCHDALDVECPDEMAKDVEATMKRIMEQPFEVEGKSRVYKVKIKIGTWWSEV